MWISCRIRSDSHTLSETVFRLFQSNTSNIRIHRVQENDFVVSVQTYDDTEPESIQIYKGYHIINAMIISLNVGSLGGFYWYDDPWVHPVLTLTDDLTGKNPRSTALIMPSDTKFEKLSPLEESDIQNVALIFGILAQEKSNIITDEYCRGLLLLRMNFYEINFRREAFLCFYRAFENFVTMRILNIPKLNNELKDLQQGLSKVGASQELIEELKELYIIRSSQIAHSQIDQRDISLDEVMKIKIFLDFIIHKTFKTQAINTLETQRKTNSQDKYK